VSGRGAGLALAAATAFVVAGAAAGQALEVQVTTVKASSSGPSDAELLDLRPRLRKLAHYRAFRVMQNQTRHCAWRNRQAFVLPGGRELYVIPKGLRDQAILMQVRLMDGPRALLDTDVRLQNRGVMLLGVERGQHADDGALIIMLRAEE
jgi:hypothetical protein